MKTKIIEAFLDREHRVLIVVPENYGNMVIQYLTGFYGPGGWGHYHEVSAEKAKAIRKSGVEVAEVNLVGPQTEVFALAGVDPEILAYAMAKYSRSSLSMKDSLKEISSQKAAEFLNTFYFAYGHKSIADLAHIPMALENISLLAAIEVVDEQRWDGQERSTRYQDFAKREYYTPEGLDEVETVHYRRSIHALFDAYEATFKHAYEHFKEQNPPGKAPVDMTSATYERTLRARAFDVARYLLPMATLTSVGQITSARTLEGQISRMLTSPHAEVRGLADKLKDASTAPTLVKYTEPNQFQLAAAIYVKSRLPELKIEPPTVSSPLVHAFVGKSDSDEEIIATLLYEHSNLPFGQLIDAVFQQTKIWKSEFIRDVLQWRGAHDELLRSFRAGGVIFDIHMDIGGMRDMHRHRRCTQIAQAYTADEFAYPEPYIPEINALYESAALQAKHAFETMRFLRRRRVDGVEPYLLPLGAKRRFLMKMDIAEVAYIAELRTGPAGHISYRRVAWEMYRALQRASPALAAGIADRVTDPDSPLDFFKR